METKSMKSLGKFGGMAVLSLVMLSMPQLAKADGYKVQGAKAVEAETVRVSQTLEGLIAAANESELRATLGAFKEIGAAEATRLVAPGTVLARAIGVKTLVGDAFVRDLKALQIEAKKSPLPVNDLMDALERIAKASEEKKPYEAGSLTTLARSAEESRRAEAASKGKLASAAADTTKQSAKETDMSFLDATKKPANVKTFLDKKKAGLFLGDEDATRVADFYESCGSDPACQNWLAMQGHAMTGIDSLVSAGASPEEIADVERLNVSFAGGMLSGFELQNADGTKLLVPAVETLDVLANARAMNDLKNGWGIADNDAKKQILSGVKWTLQSTMGDKKRKVAPTPGFFLAQRDLVGCPAGEEYGAKLKAWPQKSAPKS